MTLASVEPSAPSGQTRLRTPRRRVADASRRESVLRRASTVLLAEGFTSVSVDDLARHLKCSKSTLYAVAATKEQLVVAVTKRFFADATRRIESAVSDVTDPAERISVYLKNVGSAMSQQSVAFYQDMVSYPPTAEIYELNSAAAARRVRELIEEGVDTGQFRAIDVMFAGHLVAWAIEGIHSGRLQDDSGLSAGQAYTQLGDLLLHGLGAERTPG